MVFLLLQKSLKMRLGEEVSSCRLPELLTVVFDYSHNWHKNMMLRDPSALYRSIFPPRRPPTCSYVGFFFLQSLGQTRANAGSVRQRDKQRGFLQGHNCPASLGKMEAKPQLEKLVSGFCLEILNID